MAAGVTRDARATRLRAARRGMKVKGGREMNDTYSKVANEIAAMMGIEVSSLTPQTTLREIGVDSLEGLQLLIELERVTNATVEEADMKRFTTIQSIVDLLNERLQKAA
jgi:acyl carrier protein